MVKATICHTMEKASIPSEESSLKCQETRTVVVTKVFILWFSTHTHLSEKPQRWVKDGVVSEQVIF